MKRQPLFAEPFILFPVRVFLKRFTPSRNTITQTAEPVAAFIIAIVRSVISPKDTSIDLCRENIDTNASAKDMLRSVFNFKDALCRDFAKLTDTTVIFVNAYTAKVIITIS